MIHTLRKVLAAMMIACFSITFVAGCGDTPEEAAQKQAEREAKAQKKAQEEAEKQAKIEAEKAEAEAKARAEAEAKAARANTPEGRAEADGVSDRYKWFYGNDRYNAYLNCDPSISWSMESIERWGAFQVSIIEVDKETKEHTASYIYIGKTPKLTKLEKKDKSSYKNPELWYFGRTSYADDPIYAIKHKYDPHPLKFPPRANSIALEGPDPSHSYGVSESMAQQDSDELRALIQYIFQ